jgi:hypothetical protein
MRSVDLQNHPAESPTKRMKTRSGAASPRRSFGRELDNSMDVSFEQKGVTAFDDQSVASASTIHSEVTSVAHLRGWLDDFGRQNKQHYQKITTVPKPESLEKPPVRPKVRKSTAHLHGPTPLPPPAAKALAKRVKVQDQTSVLRARTTPIRIQQPVQDVQATDHGYASVAQLSKWLADDPTSTKKKYKELRRGAKVIAISRKFDKGLANAIIEDKRQPGLNEFVSVEQTWSEDSQEIPRVAATVVGCSSSASYKSTIISVADKKKWLAEAFQKPSTPEQNPFKRMSRATPHPKKKAATEILTKQHDDLGDRAKELWRKRSSSRTPPRAQHRELTKQSRMGSTPENTGRAVGSSSPHVHFDREPPELIPRYADRVEQDNTHLDFKAAKEWLVQRSKVNAKNSYAEPDHARTK